MYCLIYRAQVRADYEHEFTEAWSELLNNVQDRVSGVCYNHLKPSDTRTGEYTIYTRWPNSDCVRLPVFKESLNQIQQLCIYFEMLHESNIVCADFMERANRSA